MTVCTIPTIEELTLVGQELQALFPNLLCEQSVQETAKMSQDQDVSFVDLTFKINLITYKRSPLKSLCFRYFKSGTPPSFITQGGGISFPWRVSHTAGECVIQHKTRLISLIKGIELFLNASAELYPKKLLAVLNVKNTQQYYSFYTTQASTLKENKGFNYSPCLKGSIYSGNRFLIGYECIIPDLNDTSPPYLTASIDPSLSPTTEYTQLVTQRYHALDLKAWVKNHIYSSISY